MEWGSYLWMGTFTAIIVSGLVIDYLKRRERRRQMKLVVFEGGRMRIRNQ